VATKATRATTLRSFPTDVCRRADWAEGALARARTRIAQSEELVAKSRLLRDHRRPFSGPPKIDHPEPPDPVHDLLRRLESLIERSQARLVGTNKVIAAVTPPGEEDHDRC
jgi:hypothetical protein